MIRYLICFLISLSPLYALTQFIRTDSAIRERIHKDICVLASDSLQGRKSGTEGEKKAYEYIISNFREAGLQPLGTDSGSYLQPFPLVIPDYGANRWQSNQMRVNGKRLNYISDFGALSFSANGQFTGRIRRIPSGTDRTGLFNYLNRNKDEGNPVEFVLVDLDGIHDTLARVNFLSRSGAKELAGSMFTYGVTGVIFWDSRGQYYNDFFDFRAEDTLSGPVIFVTKETVKVLSTLKDNMIVELSILKPVYHWKKCNNIIGFIDNNAPYTIIIGAHYDHMGINRKNEIRYGADDNASGTATIMELARFLKNSEDRRNNYLFIAFSGEEEGLIGSNFFGSHPTLDLAKVNFMFNFDMVGRLGCEGNKVTAIATATSNDWRDVFSETPGEGFGIRKLRGAPPYSDHNGFYLKGIPVAYLTTGLHYDYHTPRDVAAKINYDGMVQIIKFTEDFISKAEDKGKITYRKVPGWYQFTANVSFFFKELDYIFNVGLDGVE